MNIFKKNMDSTATKTQSVSAIIVAAGNATRMGGVNKQFLQIDGVPVLIRTLHVFDRCDLVKEIIIAARETDIPTMFAMIQDFKIEKVKTIVKGGETRQMSVFNAIECCSADTEYLAIHDGARPLVTSEVICDTIEVAMQTKAATTATRVKDTIKIANVKNEIESTPNRNLLWAVQTPQVFQKQLYLSAMQAIPNSTEFTDDCKLLESYGVTVHLVEGSYENIKITTPGDVILAETILKGRETND